jgi:hypothetical protein
MILIFCYTLLNFNIYMLLYGNNAVKQKTVHLCMHFYVGYTHFYVGYMYFYVVYMYFYRTKQNRCSRVNASQLS